MPQKFKVLAYNDCSNIHKIQELADSLEIEYSKIKVMQKFLNLQ